MAFFLARGRQTLKWGGMLGAVLLLAFAYLLRASCEATFFAGVCVFLGTATFLGMAIAGSVVFLFLRKRPAGVILATTGALGVVLASLAFIGIGRFFLEQEIASALRYPFRIAPALEAYRTAHGIYPERLEDVKDLPPAPRYLSFHNYLRRDDDGYEFFLPNPRAMVDGWKYDSHRWQWVYED